MSEQTEVTKVPEAAEAETIHPNHQLWRDVLTGTGNKEDGSPLPIYTRNQLLDLGWQIVLAGRTEESQRPDWINRYVAGGVPIKDIFVDLLARIVDLDDSANLPAVQPKETAAKQTPVSENPAVNAVMESLQNLPEEFGLNKSDSAFILSALEAGLDRKTLVYFDVETRTLTVTRENIGRIIPKLIWQLLQLRGIPSDRGNRLGGVDKINLYDEARILLDETDFQDSVAGKKPWRYLAENLLAYRKLGPFYFSLPDEQIGKIVAESQSGKKIEANQEISPREKYETEVGYKRKEVKKAREPLIPEDTRKTLKPQTGEYSGRTFEIGEQTLAIGGFIAKGHFGEVYECALGDEAGTGTYPQVVKIKFSNLGETETHLFQMEKETLAKHSSGGASEEAPILPRYFVSSQLDGREAYVMERLDGKSLQDLSYQLLALSENYATQLLLPLARFASDEYGKGRGFQDLKLENFILSSDASGKVYLRLLDYGWTTEGMLQETPLENQQRLIRWFMMFAFRSVTCLPIDADGKQFIDPVFLNGWIESEDFRNLSWGFRFIFLKSQGLIDEGHRSFAELSDDLEDLLNTYSLTGDLDKKFISQISSPALAEALQASVSPTAEMEERLTAQALKIADDYSRQRKDREAAEAEEVKEGSKNERLKTFGWRRHDYLSTLNQFLYHQVTSLEYYDRYLGISTMAAYLRHYPVDHEVVALKGILESLRTIHQSGLIDKDPIFKRSLTNLTRSFLVNGGTLEVKLIDLKTLGQRANILAEFAGKLSPKDEAG